jgi:hypothetical protein
VLGRPVGWRFDVACGFGKVQSCMVTGRVNGPAGRAFATSGQDCGLEICNVLAIYICDVCTEIVLHITRCLSGQIGEK